MRKVLSAMVIIALLISSCQSMPGKGAEDRSFISIPVEEDGGMITWEEMGPGSIELYGVTRSADGSSEYIFRGLSEGHVTLSFLSDGRRIAAYSVTVGEDLSMSFI